MESFLNPDVERRRVAEVDEVRTVKDGRDFKTSYSETAVKVEEPLAKRLQAFLPLKLVKPPSGIFRTGKSANKVNEVVQLVEENSFVLNIGSGTTNLGARFINMDVFPFPNVDVMGNAHELPFRDNSVEAIVIIGVIEHLKSPYAIIDEIHRVLQKDGIIYAEIPFMQGFHPDPYDWQRYTIQGISELFSSHGFEQVEVGVCVGPASGFVWVLREFLAILFSLNNYYLYKIFRWFFTWLTHPLAWLDLFLQGNRFAHNIASSLFFLGKKESLLKNSGQG